VLKDISQVTVMENARNARLYILNAKNANLIKILNTFIASNVMRDIFQTLMIVWKTL